VLADELFDLIYPEPIRGLSSNYWTPVEVARRAIELLAARAGSHVLDIGAGVAKFCILGAMTSPATFTGVEHRANLVDVGRRAIEKLGVPRARMVHGTLETVPWAEFDAFYLYNPFEENLADHGDRLDNRVEMSEARFCRDVLAVECALGRATRGTRVVTYHGFGGKIPRSYRLLVEEPCGTDRLRLWEKVR